MANDSDGYILTIIKDKILLCILLERWKMRSIIVQILRYRRNFGANENKENAWRNRDMQLNFLIKKLHTSDAIALKRGKSIRVSCFYNNCNKIFKIDQRVRRMLEWVVHLAKVSYKWNITRKKTVAATFLLIYSEMNSRKLKHALNIEFRK